MAIYINIIKAYFIIKGQVFSTWLSKLIREMLVTRYYNTQTSNNSPQHFIGLFSMFLQLNHLSIEGFMYSSINLFCFLLF